MVSNCRGKLSITRSFLPTLKKLLVAMEIVCQVMAKKKICIFFFFCERRKIRKWRGEKWVNGKQNISSQDRPHLLTFHLHGVSPPTLSVCDRVPSRVFWIGSRPSRATNLSQICISLLCSTQSIMSHCCLFLDSGLNCISLPMHLAISSSQPSPGILTWLACRPRSVLVEHSVNTYKMGTQDTHPHEGLCILDWFCQCCKCDLENSLGSHVQPTPGFEHHVLPILGRIYEAVQPDEQDIWKN